MTTRLVLALVVAVVVVGALASGCTLLWLFNNDPEGLPCRFTKDQPQGECLDGYTCVGGVCQKEGEKPAGEPCARTEECASGLGCATGSYRFCNDGGDDINCRLVAKEEKELRCRTICKTTEDCQKDERCFIIDGVKGVGGMCQPGTCGSDSDCGTADDEGAFCLDFGNGRSGLCRESCNPLSCKTNGTGTCTGCDGLDDDPDDGNCIAIFGPGRVLNGDAICDDIGTTPDFESCGHVGEDLCGFGATCVAVDASTQFCAPWCSATGGNPQCAAGHDCTPINGTVGFCR